MLKNIFHCDLNLFFYYSIKQTEVFDVITISIFLTVNVPPLKVSSRFAETRFAEIRVRVFG